VFKGRRPSQFNTGPPGGDGGGGDGDGDSKADKEVDHGDSDDDSADEKKANDPLLDRVDKR
jgi:hypothetical protein